MSFYELNAFRVGLFFKRNCSTFAGRGNTTDELSPEIEVSVCKYRNVTQCFAASDWPRKRSLRWGEKKRRKIQMIKISSMNQQIQYAKLI